MVAHISLSRLRWFRNGNPHPGQAEQFPRRKTHVNTFARDLSVKLGGSFADFADTSENAAPMLYLGYVEAGVYVSTVESPSGLGRQTLTTGSV